MASDRRPDPSTSLRAQLAAVQADNDRLRALLAAAQTALQRLQDERDAWRRALTHGTGE